MMSMKAWNQPLTEKEVRSMKSIKMVVAIVLAFLMVTVGMAVGGTLQDVQKNGFLKAGVNGGVFGFSMPDEKGVNAGF